MFIPLRSTLLISAALSATSVAPAQAETSAEPLLAVESASFPKITVPELLDLESEPQLSDSDEQAPEAAPAAADTSSEAPA